MQHLVNVTGVTFVIITFFVPIQVVTQMTSKVGVFSAVV